MPVRIFQVDAFTARPFGGNPAAVCLLSKPAEEAWMQSVAGEMNLSETAFVQQCDEGYQLRWFTPVCEVDLCGHATLASAHVLWETGELAPGKEARFLTHSGLLTARKRDQEIEMYFPAQAAQATPAPTGLVEALGVEPESVGGNGVDYLVEVSSERVVRALSPDFSKLRTVSCRGVIVTAPSASPRYDFVSRFFAPSAGVNEDPVTGSAHCCLAPFWGARLHKEEMVAYQASARGGEVRVRVAGDRVLLAGRAVTVLRGELI
ncbi:MAG: PhzF family phenazine biosynthesis protein [Acidobacteriota bacterium]